MVKDNFSKQSEVYSKFRPSYPMEFISEILSISTQRKLAWDCGTGNGQVASILSSHFEHVVATDISKNQLSQAPRIPNIEYRIGSAESTSIISNSVDLITVAQAIHWFDFNLFFKEVNRVLKQDGIIATFGYPLFTTNTPIDELITYFYSEILGSFWDPERILIEKEYATIPFPFTEINLPDMYMNYEWTFDQMVGYLRSWSAVQHYIDKRQRNPLELIQEDLRKMWPDSATVTVSMKIINKVGRKT